MRGGVLGALAERAQRRVLAQLAGLDHHAAFARRGAEQRLDRGAKLRAPALTQTARRPPNSGMVLASSTRRDGSDGELVAFEPRERERIVDVVDRGADQRLGALAHQAGVGAVDQHHRLRRIGLGEEGSTWADLSAVM